MLLKVLFLVTVFLAHQSDTAQAVLKSNFETLENTLSTPKDPSDPAAWDYDWSFSGIRYRHISSRC
jgi:hypothetical protein